MAVAKRELGRTGLQVTTLGYGAMELRGAPRARDITEAQAEKSRAKTAQGSRNGGTNGPDPDYSHSYPPLRGRVRLSPVGIWRRDRYRWYSADHTRHLFVARARGIVIFRNYVADTPDRVVSAEPGYSSGRVRSAMVDGGRGCPDRSARSDARRDTQARMNAVLQIRSAPSTSQRYPEQKNCCWIAPRRRGDLLSLGQRRHI